MEVNYPATKNNNFFSLDGLDLSLKKKKKSR